MISNLTVDTSEDNFLQEVGVWAQGRREVKGFGVETPILGSQVDIQCVALNTVY